MGLDTMAPWEIASFFQPVRVTFITPGASIVPLVQADPMRVGLIFSNAGATSATILPQKTGISAGVGIALTNALPTLTFTHKDFASLVNVEWFAAPSTTTICVVEILLSKWPQKVGNNDTVPDRKVGKGTTKPVNWDNGHRTMPDKWAPGRFDHIQPADEPDIVGMGTGGDT